MYQFCKSYLTKTSRSVSQVIIKYSLLMKIREVVHISHSENVKLTSIVYLTNVCENLINLLSSVTMIFD